MSEWRRRDPTRSQWLWAVVAVIFTVVLGLLIAAVVLIATGVIDE